MAIVMMNHEIGQYAIRNWENHDIHALVKYANNRNIWMNLRDSFPHPYGIREAEAFISRINEKEPVTIFAISTQEEAIGSIGLMIGQDIHRFTGELGYWLAEPFWGKGIMTQAVKAVVEYGINRLELKRIYAEPFAHNLSSIRVLEKAGFQFEGILRSNAFKDGRILDQAVYSYVSEIKEETNKRSSDVL